MTRVRNDNTLKEICLDALLLIICPWMGGCAALPFSSSADNDGGFRLFNKGISTSLSTSSHRRHTSRSTHLTHAHCFISLAHKLQLCNLQTTSPRHSISSSWIYLLHHCYFSPPFPVLYRLIRYVICLYVAHIMCSKSRMEKPIFIYNISSMLSRLSLLWCTTTATPISSLQ